MGRFLFYIFWPLVWFYAPLTRRSRVVIVRSGKILVVKNSFGPGVWQLPGGGIKHGESAESAGSREILEELNVELKNVVLLSDEIHIVKQFGLLMRYHFLSGSLDKEITQSSSEIIDWKWIEYASGFQNERVAKEVITGLKLATAEY